MLISLTTQDYCFVCHQWVLIGLHTLAMVFYKQVQSYMQQGIRRGKAVIKYFELFNLSIDETLINYTYGNNFDCFYIIFNFFKK